VSGQLQAPAALPPKEKPHVPIEQEVGWTTGPVWTTWSSETSCPHRDLNSDPFVVQTVASRYTDYAIPDGRTVVLKLWSSDWSPMRRDEDLRGNVTWA
jgi:hypothetical protein